MKPFSAKKPKTRRLEDLRPLIREGQYRIAPHAARHAMCEGFTEQDMVGCLLYGRELIRYTEDQRLLVLGYIHPSPVVKIPLHVVVDYAKHRWVDIVTAFIPQEAYQITSRARLAEMLRYDRHEVKQEKVGPDVIAPPVLRYIKI
jgi:hypothetical protein